MSFIQSQAKSAFKLLTDKVFCDKDACLVYSDLDLDPISPKLNAKLTVIAIRCSFTKIGQCNVICEIPPV